MTPINCNAVLTISNIAVWWVLKSTNHTLQVLNE